MMKQIANNLYYGFLQMMTVLTATVLVGQLAGLSVPVILFTTGVGTLIYTVATKGRTPIAVGTSGSWLGTMIAMSVFGLDHIVGVSILGGLWYVAFGLLIKCKPNVLKIFTPHILNLAVLMIALNLIATAVGLISTAPITGIATVVAIALLMNIKSLERYSFPLGVLIGTFVHGFTKGLTLKVATMFIPTLVLPAFNLTTFGASLIFIALVTEALGDSKLVADATGKGYEPYSVIIGNGLASIVSGLFGGMSLTTYSESCALTRATKHTDYRAIIICGLLYIAMSFITPVTTLINFIPIEALSGLLLYLFSSVAVAKISDIKATDKGEEIVAIIGISAFFLAPYVLPNISQIAVGMLSMVATHLILKLIKRNKK